MVGIYSVRNAKKINIPRFYDTNFSDRLTLFKWFEMMQYEEEGEKLKDTSACHGVRADLKMCLLESDCCKRDKKTPRECLNVRDGSVPQECFTLRNTFFECKRSMLDNRTRFRGRKGY